MSKMCPGVRLGYVTLCIPEHIGTVSPDWTFAGWQEHAHMGVKRRKVKCPLCGRRVTVSVRCSDVNEFVEVVPAHKIKGWWKKSKK